MTRPELRPARLFPVWWPLALTFLLVTGSTPVVNASINRLPGRDHEADLAAFAVFLACVVVIHSPLFVSREIAIRLSVDRAGSRRALLFCIAVGAVVSLFEVLMGATPLGAWVLGGFTDRPEIVREAQPAFLWIAPVPILIAVRGVYQAHQIRADDTLFVGLGTVVRLCFTAVIGLLLAPRVGLTGPMMGAVCIVVGLLTETGFAVVRARARARPPRASDAPPVSLLAFGLPLMLANSLGVVAQLFYLRVAAMVPSEGEAASLAAFQEVKALDWLLASGAFALQSFTTAKVRTRADALPMLRFACLVGAGLSFLLGLAAFTPLREWILVDVMNEKPGGAVVRLAVPALMVAAALPFLDAIRFALRGILISRGRTRAITVANVTTLLILTTAISFRLLVSDDNGALNAYVLWFLALLVDIGILGRAAFGPANGAGLPPPVKTPRETTGG